MLPTVLPIAGDGALMQPVPVAGGAFPAPTQAAPSQGPWGSQYTNTPEEKTYPGLTFRNQAVTQSNAPPGVEVARHMFGPGQMGLSAAYVPGPRMGDANVEAMRGLVAQGDNIHPYGTVTANQSDLRADTAVANNRMEGNFGQAIGLPAHQQAHVQSEMDFAVRHQDEMRNASEGAFKQAMALTGSTVREGSAGEDLTAPAGGGVNPVHRPLTDDPVVGNSVTRGPVMTGPTGSTYTTTASGNRNYDPLQPQSTNIASSVSGSTQGWGGGSSEGGGNGPSNATVVGVSESRGEVFEGPKGGHFTETASGNRNYHAVKS